jgi:hypothetical protein
MRRFFLAQRVGIEDVARPLPDVIQSAQGAADGVVGQPSAGAKFEGVLEQGHCPTGVRKAQVLGRAGQQRLQQVLIVLVQYRPTSPAWFVLQAGGVTGLAIGRDPVVDALPCHAEHAGDVGGSPAVVKLQHGEGTPVEVDVPGLFELAAEALPLPGGQVELAHVLLHDRQSSTEQMPCQAAAVSK